MALEESISFVQRNLYCKALRVTRERKDEQDDERLLLGVKIELKQYGFQSKSEGKCYVD